MTPASSTPLFPTYAVAVTASDSAAFPPSVIYVGTGGAVAIKCAHDGSSVTFPGIPNGGTVPCMAIAVLSTGTTASGFVACR